MKTELPKRKVRRELILPRWAIPIIWAVIVLVIQIILPWAVAKLGPRFGWSQLAPAWWNLTGLIAVAIGLALYAWCLAIHFRSYRASVRVGFSPPHLVEAGPYKSLGTQCTCRAYSHGSDGQSSTEVLRSWSRSCFSGQCLLFA